MRLSGVHLHRKSSTKSKDDSRKGTHRFSEDDNKQQPTRQSTTKNLGNSSASSFSQFKRASALIREPPITLALKYSASSLRSRRSQVILPPPDHLSATESLKTVLITASSSRLISRISSKSSTKSKNRMLQARPGTGYQSSAPQYAPPQPQSPSLENITFQHIQETSIKRISTLDYLRKAHEGRVYWFNTLLLSKPDLQRISNSDFRKLARRATNYLLLGLSLPNIIDLYSSNSTEYLRTFNALLSEFESFQQTHPPDGSSSSSLSRGRLPQMFKRATTTGSKGRRTSAASDIGLPLGNEGDVKSVCNNGASGTANSTISFSISENDLLPGEEYTYLLTPSLPFDPDMNETFATLCDVLIDYYTKLLSLISSPRESSPTIAELFTKADAKIKKLILQGVVKEFEESSRSGVKNEITGVGSVVLGGLM